MAIVSFVDYLAGKKKRSDVPGLIYADHGRPFQNKTPDLPQKADDLPTPYRDCLSEMYEKGLYFNITTKRRRIDVILTSRICPFSCKYCFSPGRAKYLPHSPERVVNEIKNLANAGIDAIEIMDDTFTVNRRRAETIADQIIAANLNLEFRVRSRVDQIDTQLLRKFKRMGVRAINYGMESGSQKTLDAMNKCATVEQNESACRWTKEVGIQCQTSWILGYPGETQKDRQDTLDFISRILPDTFTLHMLQPLPATAVYKEAKENGTLIGKWGVDDDIPYIRTKEVRDKKAFEILVAWEHRKLLLDPRFIVKTLMNLVKYPNPRLAEYGFNYLRGKIRRVEGASYQSISAKA